ncbi:MAG: hypothetical protein NTY76_03725 [Candidatus Omnitrophica bacterium]|nr:hypothetical protein [Candidatus Omnitrophota bacterium]
MADEKKEELTKEAKAPEAPVTPQAAPAQASPAAAAPAEAKEEKKEAAPVVKEKPANCAGCKKSIKNKRWYYRNGKYYCTKRCWGTTNKKPAKTEEAPQKT